jgi:two-component system response regulator YesN
MENIRLENIASLFGYNSSYLGKMFSLKLGESFNSYVDKVRIENSKELLMQKSLRIYEIAEKVGYQNTDYFYMKFKKNTGITPAEYRKKYVTPNYNKDL